MKPVGLESSRARKQSDPKAVGLESSWTRKQSDSKAVGPESSRGRKQSDMRTCECEHVKATMRTCEYVNMRILCYVCIFSLVQFFFFFFFLEVALFLRTLCMLLDSLYKISREFEHADCVIKYKNW